MNSIWHFSGLIHATALALLGSRSKDGNFMNIAD
jgi:hypothetical protein